MTKTKSEPKAPAGWTFIEHETDGVVGTKVFGDPPLERTVHGKTVEEAHDLARVMDKWVAANIPDDE